MAGPSPGTPPSPSPNVLLYQSRATLAEDMRRAMETRAVIEQAKGILVAQHHCTPEKAFELLTRLSRSTHRKLRRPS